MWKAVGELKCLDSSFPVTGKMGFCLVSVPGKIAAVDCLSSSCIDTGYTLAEPCLE
jgi:hypothetical protein